ncbi:hypothetical protein K9M50_00150 [Patescibacteria group bacterium]|nr:hypothetical protein [Patescibacteria group bacterium]
MLEDSNINLNKAIVSTIAFFDIFSYPLSAFEVYKYLQIESSYSQVVLALENLEARNIISSKNSFYCLKDKEDNFAIRQRRYNYSKKKMKIAKKWAKVFRLFTSLKLVAISNGKGLYNLRKEGDIDLIIITKENKIWTTRFILATIAKLFNLRPSPKNKKDKLCLSFFVSEYNLNLQNYTKENDLDFFYWLVNFSSIYDEDNYLNKLLAENIWLKKYLPNYFKVIDVNNKKNYFKVEKEVDKKEIKKSFYNKNRNNGFIENFLKKIQWHLFPQEIKNKANKGNEVIINDEILKLHVLDKRQYYYQKYLEKMRVYEDKL